jgi:DNA recombination protein RmuC
MDNSITGLVALLIGFAFGGALGWLMTYLYSKARLARLEAEHATDAEKIEWIKEAQQKLRETFEALASRALHENAQDFSGRIQTQLTSHADHIGVLKAALDTNINQLDQHIRELESKRVSAYTALTQDIAHLREAYGELRSATEQLTNALKTGPVRGRWGEIQLRKIVELAGMIEHVTFAEQVSGVTGKPDMIVYLPNQGQLPVDSKFPLQAYLDAMTSTDSGVRKKKLEDHAKTLKQKIRELSQRSYWEDFQPGPELVIMFVPIESCLMVAYETDPDIVEFALSQRVLLASPITLLGFMKSIAYGWQQFVISKHARQILEQGKELYKRAATWMDHYRTTGDKLGAAVEAYNASVGSLQARFFPAARQFQGLTAIAEELSELAALNKGISLPPKPEDIDQAI